MAIKLPASVGTIQKTYRSEQTRKGFSAWIPVELVSEDVAAIAQAFSDLKRNYPKQATLTVIVQNPVKNGKAIQEALLALGYSVEGLSKTATTKVETDAQS